jgi:2,6-dihydroxypseudooxynicotine hydrolase
MANGVDPNDVDQILQQIERWEDWSPTWKAIADGHRERGLTALAEGRTVSAANALLYAAATYHFGSYLSSDDEAHYAEMGWLCADSYRQALPHLDPPGESLSVDYEHDRVHFWLRRPRGVTNPPVVLLIPGLDARKEELHGLGEAMVARGLAAVGIDGPGQGESEAAHHMRPDYEHTIDAVISALPTDLGPTGILGVSLGAFWAPRVAAIDNRIRATVAVCGPYDWSRSFADLVPLQKRVFWTKTRQTPETAHEHSRSFTLDGFAQKITTPLLVIHAGKDTVILPSEGERLHREVPHSELVIFEDANHVCHNRHYLMRPLAADWLAAKLRSA